MIPATTTHPASKEQKRDIAMHTPNKDIKEEWCQWATNDNNKRSTNDLNFDQANKILKQLQRPVHVAELWSKFDYKNKQHTQILALCHTAQWTVDVKGKKVADLTALDHFLKSDRCPVHKPLIDMTASEVSKVIFALGKIVKHIFS